MQNVNLGGGNRLGVENEPKPSMGVPLVESPIPLASGEKRPYLLCGLGGA